MAGQARSTKGDEYGYKRGEKGFARSKGDEEFIGHHGDPAKLFGFSRGEGDPGQFELGKTKDKFKGSKGVDRQGKWESA